MIKIDFKMNDVKYSGTVSDPDTGRNALNRMNHINDVANDVLLIKSI